MATKPSYSLQLYDSHALQLPVFHSHCDLDLIPQANCMDYNGQNEKNK